MAQKWTDASDQQLHDAVAEFGAGRGAPENTWQGRKVKDAWAKHAERVGRTAEACARRWWNQLNPLLETGKWTASEDAANLLSRSLFGLSSHTLAPLLRRGPDPFTQQWKIIKKHVEQLGLTLTPGEAVSADAVARVLRALQHGGASYDADAVADALESVGRAFTPEIAVPNARELAEEVGTALAELPPRAAARKEPKKPAAPKKPKKPAPVGVPKPRGRAPNNQSGEPATWDAAAGRWLDLAPKKPAPVGVPKPRGRAPQNRSGEPATWDAAEGRWLDVAPKNRRRALEVPPRPQSQALALAVPHIVGLLPTSKIAVTCSWVKQLVEKAHKAAERKYKMRDYPSCQATMRLGRAGISGRSLHALSTCLWAGGKGLIVASAESRVSGVGAARVLRVDEMEVDVQRAFFDIQGEVGGLFGNAERFRVVPRELFGAHAELHAGRRRPGWQNGGTDQGRHKSLHAELVDVKGAADGHRHGRRACSATMLEGLVLLADGLETKRRLFPLSGKWESTVPAHNHTILTPPGSKRGVTHFAHRDCGHCSHTGITRMPLVVLVFVRYYTLDDNGMLRRASPDLARVSGLRFRELPRAGGEDIFAQIADDGFVMFDAHANAHFTHEVMRADDPAEGIYRISIVVHLMSLPEQVVEL